MDKYLVVMEVKYSGFMLSYIKKMVSLEGEKPPLREQIQSVKKRKPSLFILSYYLVYNCRTEGREEKRK